MNLPASVLEKDRKMKQKQMYIFLLAHFHRLLTYEDEPIPEEWETSICS